jgi:hypothetical protein
VSKLSNRAFLLGLGLACLALSFIGYRALLGLPLLGFDSYPLIAAARVQSFGDFIGLFTRELMDGRYTDGHFYRPVTHAAFAFDYALHGLGPRGYHITDLFILAACGTAAGALALRLFGASARLTAGVAALVMLVHPLVMELIPVAPRRADSLALLFSMWALACTPRPGENGRAAWTFLLAALAVGAKETGALAPFLIFALVFVEASEGRMKRALRCAAPAGAGLLLLLVLRAFVLGGMGGHAESGRLGAGALAALVPEYVLRVLYPQPWAGAEQGLIYAVLALLALLLAGALLVGWRQAEQRSGLLFIGAWTLALLAISLLSGRVHDWYGFAFLAPYGLLLGVLLSAGWQAFRAHRSPVAIFLVGAPLLLLGSHLANSHIVRPYGNLLQAGELATETLSRFDRLLNKVTPGGGSLFDSWVPVLPPHSDHSEVRNLFLYGAYSMQAYADLQGLDFPLQVSVYQGSNPSPEPGTHKIHLVLGARPSWIVVR